MNLDSIKVKEILQEDLVFDDYDKELKGIAINNELILDPKSQITHLIFLKNKEVYALNLVSPVFVLGFPQTNPSKFPKTKNS